MNDNDLNPLHGWQKSENQITKTFKFKNYATGVLFVNACAYLAETYDHHPDISLKYAQVEISLSTHTAGGITQKDIDMAQKIDSLLHPSP